MTKRTVVAFLVAPLAASLVIFFLMFIVAGMRASFWLQFMVPIAYGCALVLGVPAHLLLARWGWKRLWQYALAGLTIGLAPSLAVELLPHFEGTRGVVLIFITFGGVLGPIAAAIFWTMAVRSRIEHAEV